MVTSYRCLLAGLALAALPLPALPAASDQHYRGTLGPRKIELYLAQREKPCNGQAIHHGMYRYDGRKPWLQLTVEGNAKRQFVMVEHGFTGVLLLKADGTALTGEWISPDQTRRLPVRVERQRIDAGQVRALEDAHEAVNYSNNDC